MELTRHDPSPAERKRHGEHAVRLRPWSRTVSDEVMAGWLDAINAKGERKETR